MIFEHLIKENRQAFTEKVKDVCVYLGIDPDWIMLVMWFETASTLDHRIVNKTSGVTGLIQFMPATVRSLGTTTGQLRQMSNVEQLDYVKRYLAPYRGRMDNWLDVYCAVFWSAAIGKPDDYVIKSDKVARQNPTLDINKDLDIHKWEIRQALLNSIPKQYKHLFE
ncbi:hypothetical protein [Proteiniphilum sp.]|uniref:hypothetical protein n=1 Tax=Proteiniphilum sp. TaxID=1926877 RepID=UPI003323F756